MSRQGRGSTGPGKAAALPAGVYKRAEPVSTAGVRTTVAFCGDDGRRQVFDLSRLPLPGWHEALAGAFAERTGPAGGLRTLASARGAWASLARLTRFLAALPDAPQQPCHLTCEHLDLFRVHRMPGGPAAAMVDLSEIRLLLTRPAIRGQVTGSVLDHVQRRIPARLVLADPAEEPSRTAPERLTSGFSDGELARLMAALRSDAAGIRDRIREGEGLLRRCQAGDTALADDDRATGKILAGMAATGQVPAPAGTGRRRFFSSRRDLAGRLFITLPDLPPLMMLAAALSERNGETIKELPARHRILEGRAVELDIVKRRRGPRRWFETVTWEIGPPGRELHYPGGFYLLMLELTARSRQWCGSPLLWCAWRNVTAGPAAPGGHRAVFGESLQATAITPARWAAARPRPLLADPPPAAGDGSDPGPAMPLQVSFNRIKTSMEVRRTKRMGGHLPSAARSNTMPVLFRNYLSGDPVIASWAGEVLGEALTDAEQAARAAHERAVRAAGGGPVVLEGPGIIRQDGGELDTGWSACADHSRHPATGKPCEVTFLDCFHCGNCLVTRDHLPRLLSLLDALARRRRELAEDAWWGRYGPAWVAIREDILAKFTPAEVEQARARKPGDAHLDLAENPWEIP